METKQLSLEKLVLPDFCEYDRLPVEENIEAVLRLKKERDALVLCHTYQRPEIHQIADVVGDSYALSHAAMMTKNPLIVFCGVHFMAETAKILNPEKKVLLPSLDAGCGLAESIDGERVRKWKEQYKGLPLVLYINSSADVKAEADIICTSANTVKAVEAVSGDKVLFAPDKNLYYNTQPRTKKILIPWEGYCPVHKIMSKDMLEYVVMEHPNAEIVVHPECNPDVTEMADAVLSTSAMADYVKKSGGREFIIGTEEGLIQMLQRMFPERQFYGIPQSRKSCDGNCKCPYMKAITIGRVRRALEEDKFEINVAEDIRVRALAAIVKMLALGRDT